MDRHPAILKGSIWNRERMAVLGAVGYDGVS